MSKEKPGAAGENFQLYFVVSQTGSIVSRLLRAVTGAPYNHVSISLDQTLRRMYSFGRIHPYNPVWGGFVMESPQAGTFKRFSETEAVVLCMEVNPVQYQAVAAFLQAMYADRHRYHYNYLGLFLAAFHIEHHGRNCFYCSEFVKWLLIQFQIAEERHFESITKPIHFLQIENCHMVYCGKLRNYYSECSYNV